MNISTFSIEDLILLPIYCIEAAAAVLLARNDGSSSTFTSRPPQLSFLYARLALDEKEEKNSIETQICNLK